VILSKTLEFHKKVKQGITNVSESSGTLITKIKACTPCLDMIADITLDTLEQHTEEYLRGY
jgi:hypothetical protein